MNTIRKGFTVQHCSIAFTSKIKFENGLHSRRNIKRKPEKEGESCEGERKTGKCGGLDDRTKTKERGSCACQTRSTSISFSHVLRSVQVGALLNSRCAILSSWEKPDRCAQADTANYLPICTGVIIDTPPDIAFNLYVLYAINFTPSPHRVTGTAS